MGYPFHPLANLFPLIEGEDFEKFVAGFRADGTLHDKIVILDGQILDGRNRQRACEATGITPHYEHYNAAIHGDPLTYVISKNLHRRHLTDDQRRMVAARIATMERGRPTENPPNGRNISTEDAAAALHVDVRGTERAKEIIAKGADELRGAVDAGNLSVRAAADITKLTPDEQRDLVSRADPRIVKDVARKLRGGDINGARALMGSRVEPPDSLDYFPTPPWATRALVEKVLPKLGRRSDAARRQAWEPACGEGHIAGVLEEYFATVIASDIFDYSVDGKMPPAWWRALDFLDPTAGEDGTPVVDWIITNPPFSDKAEAFVLRAIDLAKVGVAMFFRLQWLETVGRYERIFAAHPPAVIAQFAERVPLHKGAWKPDGSTATAYLWIVWLKGRDSRHTEFVWIPPGQREALTRPGDVDRFTAHPVLPRHDPHTGEIIESIPGVDLPIPARGAGEEAAPHPSLCPPGHDGGAASPSDPDDELDIPAFLRRVEGVAPTYREDEPRERPPPAGIAGTTWRPDP